METPSEWAKRFNPKASEVAGSSHPQAETADNSAPVTEFPSEPFQCPACGQLLAPSCRVCVACKHTIDPAKIARPQEVAPPAARTISKLEPVRYPWRLFFLVLGSSFFLALIFEGLWGQQKAQLAMGGAQTLVGVWVFFDALRQRVQRPARWALGTMLLPVVIFPWYLARRNKPNATVRFVEAEAGPVTRFLLFALLAIFLASLIFYIVKNPPSTIAPTPAPKNHRIARLHPGQEL